MTSNITCFERFETLDASAAQVFQASTYTRMLWFAAQLLPIEEQCRYHIVRAYHYSKAVDMARLSEALQVLADGNYNLRSNFFEKDGRLFQSVKTKLIINVGRYISSESNDRQAQIYRFAKSPINLTIDPLCAFLWIGSPDDIGGTFVVKFHHIILSGVDLDAIITDIGQAYDDLGSIVPDAIATSQLLEWISNEADFFADYSAGSWASRLKGVPDRNRLLAYERVSNEACTASLCQSAKVYEMESMLYKKLMLFKQTHNCSIFDIYKIIWGIVLCHCTGDKRVLINFPIDVRCKVGRAVKGAMINTLFYMHVNEGSFLEALQAASLRGVDKSFFLVPTAIIANECSLNSTAFNFTIAQSDLGLKGPILGSNPNSLYIPCVGSSELLLICDGPCLVYQHTLGNQVSDQFFDDLHRLFVSLLSASLADPNCDIGDMYEFALDSATLEGEHRDRRGNLLECILAVANRQPKALAIVDGSRSISYRALIDSAVMCGRTLRELPKKGSRNIGVMLPRGIELIVTMLGIWMADLIFVPLDHNQPSDRLGSIARDADLRALVHNDQGVLPTGWHGTLIDVALAGWLVAAYSGAEFQLAQSAEEVAYIIYTSGSTGVPKGVVQTHRTIANLIEWECEHLPLPIPARIAQVSAVGFDVSVEEICFALATGSELHVVNDMIKLSSHRLISFLREAGIHRVFMPTALLDGLCRAALNEEDALPELLNLTVAGEALKITASIAEFFDKYPQISLFNEYGPTETHVVTVNELAVKQHIDNMSLIGTPISNTIGYVLGDRMRPVPQGLIGELYIGGDGVALGYHRRSDLTAQRFIANPFVCASERYPYLYRTGDLVRITSDNQFEYIGRSDMQVKINGRRIELAEIECKIIDYAGIAEVAVLVAGDQERQRLVAFYVATGDIDEGRLRQRLAEQLPDYMLPSLLIQIAALPLNPNGKVDRIKLLSEIKKDGRDRRPPTTAIENLLCETWKRILGTDDVGIDDDLFSIGVDSLRALNIIDNLYEIFGCSMTVVELYSLRTIREVLRRLGECGTRAGSVNLIVPLRRRGGNTRFFLFHSGRGGVEVYQGLAQRMNCDVFGVEAFTVYHDFKIHDIDELCAIYAQAIIAELRPEDVLILGGWSFGGLLAYNVAQYQGLRDRVLGLVIYDTASVEVFRRLPLDESSAWSERVADGGRGRSAFRQRLLAAARLHDELYRSARPCVDLPDIPILYFAAKQADLEYAASADQLASSSAIWQKGHSHLDLISVPSTHFRMMEQCGQDLAILTRAFVQKII